MLLKMVLSNEDIRNLKEYNGWEYNKLREKKEILKPVAILLVVLSGID
jgi:hypothetical protein